MLYLKRPSLMRLTCLSVMSVALISCANQGVSETTKVVETEQVALALASSSDERVSENGKAIVEQSKASLDTRDAEVSSETARPMIYFQKEFNTPVYDLDGEVTRSLRLQAFVPVYAFEDDKAFISKQQTEWVFLSALTIEEPDMDTLPEGTLSNGLETLDRERLKDMVKNGRK